MSHPPASRHLRILAFDPSLATRIETRALNRIDVSVPWEPTLEDGPVGEYVEVVDFDPASGVFYTPVNLNDHHVVAERGVAASESDPHFHQQMVYAVAMTTIGHFERALGRVAFWSDRVESDRETPRFVQRLRLYPHALRDRNAFYSPSKKAILFGYFPVLARDENNTPGTLVFTCLSHDIIAHEVTHALLDGVHPHFTERSHPDVLAFHEAFADIVALFQHFSYPSVLESQIAATRGSLHSENLLSQLAQQFGLATGRGGALRDALWALDADTGEWGPKRPDPRALDHTLEPHARGAILVAAIFRAFLRIYTERSADLFRIATQGTGRLPEGDIHPDLTRRLAREAARSADRVLQICIRAIDYCPPVGVTFGDFLRGLITADMDFAPEDEAGYRTVFIQSFREWGIVPRGVLSMGEDALAWPRGADVFFDATGTEQETPMDSRMVDFTDMVLSKFEGWNLLSDRKVVWETLLPLRDHVREWLLAGEVFGADYAKAVGLDLDPGAPRTVHRDTCGRPEIRDTCGRPEIIVHSVRPVLRRVLGGASHTDIVVEITQRRRGYFDATVQRKKDNGEMPIADGEHGDFTYRAGCTIHFDPHQKDVRRVIRTHGSIIDDRELERVRSYLSGELGAVGNAFDAGLAESVDVRPMGARDELFALLHDVEEEER